MIKASKPCEITGLNGQRTVGRRFSRVLVLLEIPGFELDRADISQGFMPPLTIIEPLDVFEQILLIQIS
jgi:hypothetical protein